MGKVIVETVDEKGLHIKTSLTSEEVEKLLKNQDNIKKKRDGFG